MVCTRAPSKYVQTGKKSKLTRKEKEKSRPQTRVAQSIGLEQKHTREKGRCKLLLPVNV